VDVEVDSLYVKRIAIEDIVGYVYIVRVDYDPQIVQYFISNTMM
jgi:hypothetical protein